MQLTVAHFDDVGPTGDLVVDGCTRVEVLPRLVDVSELHRRTDDERTGVGSLLSDEHAEQRGLSCTVRANDANDAAGGKDEAQVLHELAITEALGDGRGVHHQVTETRAGWNGDLELGLALLCRLGFGHEVVEGVEARLALALPRPRGHADPLELTGERLLTGLIGSFLCGQASLLLLEPRRVVPLPRNTRTTVELEDPARHVVQEVAVVGDGHNGPGVVPKRSLQPRHRLSV